ncbi:MAG: Wzt carbohydrate-binding domain-containing protein, partial [Acidobacteria bacterium]|nr:Wzt carbohydrate-binding domain-containing protein [Acidobacteriota bacterium]
VQALGASGPVIRQYENFLLEKTKQAESAEWVEEAPGPVRIEGVRLRSVGPEAVRSFRRGEAWCLEVEWQTDRKELQFQVGASIDRVDGVQVAVFSTFHDGLDPFSGRTRYRTSLELPELPLISGEFSVYVYVTDEHALHVYDRKIIKNAFEVVGDDFEVGLLRIPHRWGSSEAVAASPLPAAVKAGR